MADKTWAELTWEQRVYVRELLMTSLADCERGARREPTGNYYAIHAAALRAALAALPEVPKETP